MENNPIKLDLTEIKRDLLKGITECSQRGLLHSTKWLSELNYSISHVKVPLSEYTQSYEDCEEEIDVYFQAKMYFDAKEYDRCAYFTKSCVTPKPRFLHLYAKYLSGEKKKIDNMTESNCPPDPSKNKALKSLLTTLQADYISKKLDGYGLYLYGIVLKKLDLLPMAVDILLEAVHTCPLHWGAWLELSPLIPDREKLVSISLPDHWMKHFFMAHSYLEQLCNDEALEIYLNLQNEFEKSNYLMAQIAIAYHNRRGNIFITCNFNFETLTFYSYNCFRTG